MLTERRTEVADVVHISDNIFSLHFYVTVDFTYRYKICMLQSQRAFRVIKYK